MTSRELQAIASEVEACRVPKELGDTDVEFAPGPRTVSPTYATDCEERPLAGGTCVRSGPLSILLAREHHLHHSLELNLDVLGKRHLLAQDGPKPGVELGGGECTLTAPLPALLGD